MRINRKKITVLLPDGYSKPSLPWFTEWVTALESGKYRRVAGSLTGYAGSDQRTGYCCLGVLSKIQCRLTDNGWDVTRAGQDILSPKNPSVKKGIMSSRGAFPKGVKVVDSSKQVYDNLAQMNDRGHSFKTIANTIKQIWKP